MLKLAREGRPFIFGFLVITVLTAVFAAWWAFFPLVLSLFMVYFFRDPERKIPKGDNIFVSPADGKIIFIQDVKEARFLKGDAIEVSIFMSPFDVHVNRIPFEGVVESVVHTPGRFLSAFKHEASLQNENIAIILNTKCGNILVRQVAGFLARRAVCRVKPGDSLQKGDRYGIIKFSSRVEVYLPKDTRIKVAVGDTVRAGETVIGEI